MQNSIPLSQAALPAPPSACGESGLPSSGKLRETKAAEPQGVSDQRNQRGNGSRRNPAGFVALPLPRLSACEAERFSRISAWRPPLGIPGYDTFMLVRIEQSEAEANWPTEQFAIEIELGDNLLGATMPRGIVIDLLGALDPELKLNPFPPPDLAALLLEAVLTQMLEHVERATGRNLRFKSVVPLSNVGIGAPASSTIVPEPDAAGGTPNATAYLSLRGPRVRQNMTLSGAAAVLATLFDRWPAGRRPLAALPLRLSFQVGTTLLPIGVAASLRTGDAILLQDIFGAGPWKERLPQILRLVVEGQLTTIVRLGEGGWRLDAAPQPNRQAGYIMVDNEDNTASDATIAASDLDNLPVRLVFEAARLDLPLGEVRSLGSGSVLQVDAKPGTVRILANGQPIGVGELVIIDERAGVRITAFHATSDTLPQRIPAR